LERVLTLNPNHEQARSAAHAARLKVGVAAAKAHLKGRARELLTVVVGAEPDNELAWMWLANIADSPAEAATCLEKVLAINPGNDLARSTYERCRSSARLAQLATPAAAITPIAVQAEYESQDARPTAPKTILMVDDDPDVREALARVLVDAGYQIIAAADSYEAIAVLRDQGAPDLVLLAAALPGGMDGYQLCKILRENAATAQMPMVLLSETSSFVSKMRGRMAGAAAELVKPFVASELLRVVNDLCPHKAK
jgi:CheY-like chemotaxis protein